MKLTYQLDFRIANNMDIQCEILPVPFSKLADMEPGEPSGAIRDRGSWGATTAPKTVI